MSKPSVFFALAAVLTASHLQAADYLVRLETVEQTLDAKTEKVVKEDVVSTVDVLCHPGVRSVAQTTIGKETARCNVLLFGPVRDGEFSLQVYCCRLKDTGTLGPPDANGVRSPLPDQSVCLTNVTLRSNEWQIIGNTIATRQDKKKRVQKTATLVRLMLQDFNPLDGEPRN